MYTKRIQIVNYGPIDQLDITFPFKGDTPKPIVLVGENGSGKSIFLSHIVNILIFIKGLIYPETPEVEVGKVYKLRDNSYIKLGSEIYFAKVDFEDGLFMGEMRSWRLKQDYPKDFPELFGSDMQEAWKIMPPQKNEYLIPSIDNDGKEKIKDIFSKNCVLYFPFNRFEDPAWLNEENLKARAEYMGLKRIRNHTNRKIINYSPLRENQNWLLDVIFDASVYKTQPKSAGSIYETALRVVREVVKKDNQQVTFGVDQRHKRVVSIEGGKGPIVPNIFQLSSGETSLLNIFLSILRDFDLCGASFAKAEEVRGIAIVDEIDLHLHADHQYTILPKLIQMFPRVQFIVTTHSPLFALGMKNIFGDDGFSLYRLPQGQQISPEEFSEFENAYQSFTATRKFSSDIRKAIQDAQGPIIFVEGKTDQKYLQKASELLGQEEMLEKISIQDGEGSSNLKMIWKLPKLPNFPAQKIILLFDGDSGVDKGSKGNIFKRKIPQYRDHPIKKGIENLFSKKTLEKALKHKSAFINIASKYTKTERGKLKTIPEEWTIDENEKTNLCDWLCKNGTADNFQHFQVIFDLLQETLDLKSPSQAEKNREKKGNK